MAMRINLTAVFLELLVVLCALVGGTLMIVDPSGALLGLNPRILQGLPVSTFFWPGVVMIAANAVMPMIVVVAALRRASWAKIGHVSVGALLSSWLILQLSLVGIYHVIQLMFLALGIAIAMVALQAARVDMFPRHRSHL